MDLWQDEGTIHYAARTGDLLEVSRLLRNGVPVDLIGRRDITPLLEALSRCREEVCQVLIAAGADVNASHPPPWSLTALMMAAECNSAALVQLLLDHGADTAAKTEDNLMALTIALTGHRFASADVLQQAGSPIRIYEAALLGDNETIQRLFAEGADLNEEVQRMTPVVVAGWEHRDETVALLLRLGARVDTLHDAAVIGSPEMVRKLIAEGHPINGFSRSGNTSLMDAAIAGRLESIQTLVDLGADLFARSDMDYTALDWAKARHQDDAARLLERLMTSMPV